MRLKARRISRHDHDHIIEEIIRREALEPPDHKGTKKEHGKRIAQRLLKDGGEAGSSVGDFVGASAGEIKLGKLDLERQNQAWKGSFCEAKSSLESVFRLDPPRKTCTMTVFHKENMHQRAEKRGKHASCLSEIEENMHHP